MNLKEFAPALRFLGLFLGIYLLGNIAYGLFVEAYGKKPDPITVFVSKQSAHVLNFLDGHVLIGENKMEPKVFFRNENRVVLNIYEGCNGINVMIVFSAFLFAFGGRPKNILWYLPLGLAIVHIINIGRIVLLYFVGEFHHHYFYYVHKYIFTAIIYVFVFVLWYLWVVKFNGLNERRQI